MWSNENRFLPIILCKISSKWIKNWNTALKIPTLSEKNIVKAWQNKGTGENILKRTPIVQEIMPRLDKCD